MRKIKPSDLRRRAQELLRTKTMPSLDSLLEAIAEARTKYTRHAKQAKSAGHKEVNGSTTRPQK
jgi:hypothetical protein